MSYVRAKPRMGVHAQRVSWKPVAIEIDADGRMLVTETGHHRIQLYQKDND